MWTDLPWQLWFFATPVGTQVGTKKIFPDCVPVLTYVLNETKKENMHFSISGYHEEKLVIWFMLGDGKA